MDTETGGIVAGVVVALLVVIKKTAPYLKKHPRLAAFLVAILVASVVFLSALAMSGCRSSIPVIVTTKNYSRSYQCSTVVMNENGQVDWAQSDCIRGNGDIGGDATGVESSGGSGDDTIDIPSPLPTPDQARMN